MVNYGYHQTAMSTVRPPRSGPSFPKTVRFKVHKRDADIAAALSERFRSGAIYSYSFEQGTWSTWATEADWLATERATSDGREIRDQAAAAAGHGAIDWDRDALVAELGLNVTAIRKRKPGKAEYVGLLTRMMEGSEWAVEEIADLLAQEAA